MKLSVIIPTLDEESRIGDCLAALSRFPDIHDVIVSDGGSADRTVTVARRFGATVIQAPRGRAAQQNAGAARAAGDTFLFLHADALLPCLAPAVIRRVLSAPGVAAGAFRTRHVASRWTGRKSLLLRLADIRSRYSPLPYGDQALFMPRESFERVGGFPDMELMEDLEMSKRLSKLGAIRVADAQVRVSGRRFESAPIYQSLLVNAFPVLYSLGVPPGVLARLYGAPR